MQERKREANNGRVKAQKWGGRKITAVEGPPEGQWLELDARRMGGVVRERARPETRSLVETMVTLCPRAAWGG